jgi:chain length determinant protein EpsF
MDLIQYWLALKARRKAFLNVFLLTVLTAVVVGLAMPRRYDATATVLTDAPDEQMLGGEGVRTSARERAGYLVTQVDLIRSGTVAHRVVRELKLTQDPAVREAWESETGGAGRLEDWIADKLVEDLLVTSGASSVLLIRYSARDPKTAATVANAFAKAYLETSLDMRTHPNREAAAWFEGQLKSLRAEVTQAQRRLATVQKERGMIGAPDERIDVEYSRFADLSAQLATAKAATLEAETRYKQAREAAASALTAGELPEVLNNPYIITVKTSLQAAESRLDDLSQVLGKNHPQYQRAAVEVQALKERLNVETKKVVASLGNIAAQARKREQEVAAGLADQQNRLIKLKDARVELAVLNRDLDNAQRAYDLAQRRYMETKLESQASKTNLALLTPAIEPLKPAVPKPWLVAALALVVGTLLGLGTVYLLEMLDRKVRSRSDLEQRLAVPSLGGLSRWIAPGGRLLPAPVAAGAPRALPHPW